MDHNTELGQFLRSRRASLDPGDVGLSPSVNARRVPGLRREEVALLAGVSADYYARLEQGRHPKVSESVLAAISRALRLDEVERGYLLDLARPPKDRSVTQLSNHQQVRPEIHRMLEVLNNTSPAIVLNHRQDVLAANRLARGLITDFNRLPYRSRNLARYILLEPEARSLYTDWEEVAGIIIANLRLAAAGHPDDPKLNELIGELSIKAPELHAKWSNYQVDQCAHGSQRFRHAVVGELTLYHETLTLPADSDQSICLYTAKPGSKSEQTLGLLASWTSTDTKVISNERQNVEPHRS
ncbi:helix-turn-helix transcriptional regulator [Arthrobacter sp. KNU40]|uniref:helix-turn-helix transcriptional regulator n=1 Tax=Arthrobacter sp. KNU40 TaxID=3447965 RepID=UPI003F62E92E